MQFGASSLNLRGILSLGGRMCSTFMFVLAFDKLLSHRRVLFSSQETKMHQLFLHHYLLLSKLVLCFKRYRFFRLNKQLRALYLTAEQQTWLLPLPTATRSLHERWGSWLWKALKNPTFWIQNWKVGHFEWRWWDTHRSQITNGGCLSECGRCCSFKSQVWSFC